MATEKKHPKLENLARLRMEAGYKKRAPFARLIGVNERTYSSWELGEAIMGLEDAIKIADTLSCSLDDLFGRKPPEKTENETGEDIRDQMRDEMQAEINAIYEDLSDMGKKRVLLQARVEHTLEAGA